jgi:hypothetical protein
MTSAAGDPRSRDVSQNVRPPERFGRHLCAVPCRQVTPRSCGSVRRSVRADVAGVAPLPWRRRVAVVPLPNLCTGESLLRLERRIDDAAGLDALRCALTARSSRADVSDGQLRVTPHSDAKGPIDPLMARPPRRIRWRDRQRSVDRLHWTLPFGATGGIGAVIGQRVRRSSCWRRRSQATPRTSDRRGWRTGWPAGCRPHRSCRRGRSGW